MEDTAKLHPKSESGRSSYRKVWWMRFWVPPIALLAWLYFGVSAGSAYELEKDGVVVSGEVIKTDTSRRTDYVIVRFTTAEGRQVETSVAPKTCGLKQPGDPIKVRYLPSDPTNVVQDACDPPHTDMSGTALLVAVVTTAASVLAWRLWRRHRKAGHVPAEDFG
jgi:hypothetical protein